MKQIKEIVDIYGFPFYCLPIEAVYASELKLIEKGKLEEWQSLIEGYISTYEMNLTHLFQSTTTNTTKEDLQYHLRTNLLARICQTLK